MGQAWHNSREGLGPLQETESSYWRATKHWFSNAGSMWLNSPGQDRTVIEHPHPAVVEAAPDAEWKRFSPFDSYRPTSKAREVEVGAHLAFLRLRNLLRKSEDGSRRHLDLFHRGLVLFANEYGLLGIFQRDYLPKPVLPRQKIFIAPEAVVDKKGRLRLVEDPATEGRELLLRLKERDPWFVKISELASYDKSNEANAAEENSESEVRTFKQSLIALPSEIRFIPKVADHSWPRESSKNELVSWNVIKEKFGALLVLDETSRSGVSVLCTREPLFGGWLRHLDSVPSLDDKPVAEVADYLSSVLVDVSICALVGEGGELRRGWRCDSLLDAMHLMLFLDATSDYTVKKCDSRGCPNYFRVGPQSSSKYCSERCANRASTRMQRGQEP